MVRPFSGFTSIEVLIAIAVLAVVSVAATGIAQLTTRIAVEADQSTIALNIARGEIGKIRQLSYENVGIINGNPAGLIDPGKTVNQNNRYFTVLTSVQLVEDAQNPGEQAFKQVTVKVTWNRITGETGEVSLSTLVTPLGFQIVETTYNPDNAEATPSPCAAGTPTPTGAVGGIEAFDDIVCFELDDILANPDILITVLDNDSGANLVVTITDQPDHGTVTVNPDGTITYTPGEDFDGTDTFTYEITDGDGNTDQGDVTIYGPPTIVTPTPTPSGLVTPTPSDSGTPDPSGSATPTPSESGTPEPLGSATPTPSGSNIPTPSDSVTPTPSEIATPTPSGFSTPTPSGFATPTPTVTVTPTLTVTPVPTPAPSFIPAPTVPPAPPTGGGPCVAGSICLNGTICTSQGYCPNLGGICPTFWNFNYYTTYNFCTPDGEGPGGSQGGPPMAATTCLYAGTSTGEVYSYSGGLDSTTAWTSQGQPLPGTITSLVSYDPGSGPTLHAGGVGGVWSYSANTWTNIYTTIDTITDIIVASNGNLYFSTNTGDVLVKRGSDPIEAVGVLPDNSSVTALKDFGGSIYAGITTQIEDPNDPSAQVTVMAIYQYSEADDEWYDVSGIISTTEIGGGIQEFETFFDGGLHFSTSLAALAGSLQWNAVQTTTFPDSTSVNALMTHVNGLLYAGVSDGSSSKIMTSNDGQFFIENSSINVPFIHDFAMYSGVVIAATGNNVGNVYYNNDTNSTWDILGSGEQGTAVTSLNSMSCSQPLSPDQPYNVSFNYSWSTALAKDVNSRATNEAEHIDAGACYQPPGNSFAFSGDQSGTIGSEIITVNVTDPVYAGQDYVLIDVKANWDLLYLGENDENDITSETDDITLTVGNLRNEQGETMADQVYTCTDVYRQVPLCSATQDIYTTLGQMSYSAENGVVTFTPAVGCVLVDPLTGV